MSGVWEGSKGVTAKGGQGVSEGGGLERGAGRHLQYVPILNFNELYFTERGFGHRTGCASKVEWY